MKFNNKVINEIGEKSLNNFHFVIEKINKIVEEKNIFIK